MRASWQHVRGGASLLAHCAIGGYARMMMDSTTKKQPDPQPVDDQKPEPLKAPPAQKPEPTRFGDWEINGRCIDF
jgi:hypothetical protein